MVVRRVKTKHAGSGDAAGMQADVVKSPTRAMGADGVAHAAPRVELRAGSTRMMFMIGQFDLLFGFVYDKRYELVCPVCNGGWKLDPFAAERTFGKPEIPFHLRYGIWVLAALAVAVGTAAYLYRQRGG